MDETAGHRRSGRVRKAVKSYADEQLEDTNATKPLKRKNNTQQTSADSDLEVPIPHSKKPDGQDENDPGALDAQIDGDHGGNRGGKGRKKAVTKTKAIGKPGKHGVVRLITIALRPPGERCPPPVFPIKSLAIVMASNFGDSRQRQVSRVLRLMSGDQKTRLTMFVPDETDSYNT